MARRKDNPWLPSGGVLVVAVIAAVLAAILLNVYTIMGAFDINPEDRKEDRRIMDVLYNIQVKAVGGSSEATEVKRRADNNITVELKQTQIRQLLQIKESLVDKHFIVSLSPSPTGRAGEPKFSDEILDYIAQLNRVVPPATP